MKSHHVLIKHNSVNITIPIDIKYTRTGVIVRSKYYGVRTFGVTESDAIKRAEEFISRKLKSEYRRNKRKEKNYGKGN
jgi:hypothetical protein